MSILRFRGRDAPPHGAPAHPWRGGAVYAVEVKTAALYAKSHEKAHGQILRYMDRLGVSEGWLVVADPDLAKPWDGKISTTDIPEDGKTIHLVRC